MIGQAEPHGTGQEDAGGVKIQRSHEMGYPGACHRYGAVGPPSPEAVPADFPVHDRTDREMVDIQDLHDIPDLPVRLINVQLRDWEVLVHQIAFH